MLKRVLLIVGIIILALVLFEVFKLLELRSSVDRYASYWKGQASQGGEFNFVVIGDSAAQGIGASKPQLGYVGLLSTQISEATGKRVHTVNLSVTGATVKDVLDKQLPQLKKYKADLIVVGIGSNNINKWDEKAFTDQYDQLAKNLPKGTVVANIPYFGGRSRENDTAIKASAVITDAAKRYDLELVDLQTYTAQHNSWRNYAADFFHPNNHGYRIWADAFWPVIKMELNR